MKKYADGGAVEDKPNPKGGGIAATDRSPLRYPPKLGKAEKAPALPYQSDKELDMISPEARRMMEQKKKDMEQEKKQKDMETKGKKAGGKVNKYAAGGSVSKRADGCAVKGKTRGKMV